ncbi:MAG TPA: hypothetical protein PLP42_07630, partial [Acidobacteriota bacterium]|nr:hypothetical protein [Acidobacteriota bacterium]
ENLKSLDPELDREQKVPRVSGNVSQNRAGAIGALRQHPASHGGKPGNGVLNYRKEADTKTNQQNDKNGD